MTSLPKQVVSLSRIVDLISNTLREPILERCQKIKINLDRTVKASVDHAELSGLEDKTPEEYKVIMGEKLWNDLYARKVLADVIEGANTRLTGPFLDTDKSEGAKHREISVKSLLNGIEKPELRYYAILVVALAPKSKTQAIIEIPRHTISDLFMHPEETKVELLTKSLWQEKVRAEGPEKHIKPAEAGARPVLAH